MKTQILFLLPLLTAGPLRSQIERPIPYPLPESKAWKKALANGTRTRIGLPGPKYWTNRATYDIEAELDPATAKVEGHVEIEYRNRSPNPIRRIRIHLRQNLHKEGSVRNRFVEITGGVKTSNLRVEGKELPKGRVVTRGTVMTIRLPKVLRPGGKQRISMDWEYRVPKAGAPRNGHEDFHVYWIAYWYPQVAVYDDLEGWVAEQYMSNAEFYMDYADYRLAFTAPSGWIVRATGTLKNPSEVLTKTQRKRLAKARESREIVHVLTKEELKAGKATRRHRKKLTWRYEARNVRDLVVSVSDRYVWDATHAVVENRDGPGKDGICMIHALYRPEARAFARAAEFERHTIEFMSSKVHPYPWPQMTACEGIIGGGMEFPMMTICSGRGRSVHGVVTHELIHMWFPMLVGSNEKAYAWQDEGLTSFFTNLTTADFRRRDLEKKTPNRSIDRRGPGSRPGRRGRPRAGMRFRSIETLAPIMRHGDRFPGRSTYSLVSYFKTSMVLAQLRDLIGEEPFFKAFREYVKAWAYKHPAPADFFATFERISGRELDWYFREWFYETWKLDQAIESVKRKENGAELVVGDRGYATMPTEIEVTFADGRKETLRIGVEYWLSGRKTRTLQLGPGVVRIEIDPKRKTLDSDRKNNVWKAE